MLAILGKLVPFRDWIYAGAAVALVIFYNVHVHNLEVHYAKAQVDAVVTAVTDAKNKTLAEAQKKIDALNAQHAEDLAQVETNYEESIQKSDVAHAADLQRLRQLAANVGNGGGGPAVEGAAGSGAPTDSGGSSLIGLGYVSAELAAALHDARDDLGKCYAERDSLTGK